MAELYHVIVCSKTPINKPEKVVDIGSDPEECIAYTYLRTFLGTRLRIVVQRDHLKWC